MKMFCTRKLLLLLIISIEMVSFVQAILYLYDTEESASVEVYDCFYYASLLYCRRPSQPIGLSHEEEQRLCHHQGVAHSFFSLWEKNASVNEVLHHWKSSLDKAEEYAHYLENGHKSKETTSEYLCQCHDGASFGPRCEYRLPAGNDLDLTVYAKFHEKSKKLMYNGDIVCYTTIECNSGLLCLDWRDICDGRQQCMSGQDEENCDKLEFNECEDDEYRCENGMCIPDEYFLDGEYDCMDLSDEREPMNDTQCPFQAVSVDCDDRICSRNRWSCGDGQCISAQARFPISGAENVSCMNRRDQFFWCESVIDETLWTLENGRCSAQKIFDEQNITEYCQYLRICTLPSPKAKDCSCERGGNSCLELFHNKCSSWSEVHYPAGALIAPYLFGYANDIFLPLNERFWKLNGTIKCRGYQITFVTTRQGISLDITTIEADLCHSTGNGFRRSPGGYDPFCSNDSGTFNNRSYQAFHSCNYSSMCSSVYRVEDGQSPCLEMMPVDQSNAFVKQSCANVRRHRFRCSEAQTTCFYANELGNSHSRCQNEYDEYSMITQMTLTRTQCNQKVKAECWILRRNIQSSWNASISTDSPVEQSLVRKIPFRVHCDTFPDILSKEDESSRECQSSWICFGRQWQCHSGHCIEPSWVLDGEWDCPDRSDEENIVAFDVHPFNTSLYAKKFRQRYPLISLWSVCNSTVESLCHSNNVSDPQARKRYCINVASTNARDLACLSACDEQTVMDHCYQSLVALGHQPRCISMQTCLTHSPTFGSHIYTGSSDRQRRSAICTDDNSCSHSRNFSCWDGTRTTRRCKGCRECPQGEDEYMCPQEVPFASPSRERKKLYLRTRSNDLQLRRYPRNTSTASVSPPDVSLNWSRSQSRASTTPINSSLFSWCNRGIPINYNDSFVCFCPPQYHGEQCQYHTDRIIVRLHIDFNHSNYTTTSDTSIVNKFLLLLVYGDEVLSTEEFHLRPTKDIQTLTRKMIHLHYPHAKDRIIQKQQRYFNRSDIIHHHPYSVRIEAYEMKETIKPRRFAVWQYPIYFDFLPVYRLAKVLRFIDPTENRFDPCGEQACGLNEDCYQLQNQPSAHICLCKNDFSGPQCSVASALCQQNHCAPNALCLPGYRGVIHGREWPYCICPLNYIGQRCLLTPNACRENSCANNGSCYQRSKPHEFKCECTSEYTGDNCTEPIRLAQLNLENTTSEYEGTMIQVFEVDFVTLELQRVHQSIYSTWPRSFQYPHSDRTAPALILLKLYHLKSEMLHLLSVQINQTSIRMNVSINEDNQCKKPRHLSAPNEGESIDLFECIPICCCSRRKNSFPLSFSLPE